MQSYQIIIFVSNFLLTYLKFIHEWNWKYTYETFLFDKLFLCS